MQKLKNSDILNFFCRDIKINYFDIGASLPLNKIVYLIHDYSNFFFFEPIKNECIKIKNYFKNNSNYKIFPYAISTEKQKILYVYNRINFSSFFKLDKKYYPLFGKIPFCSKKFKVPCMSLDFFFRSNKKSINKNYLNVLKIDTQGNSLDCLKSCKKNLKKFSIFIIENDNLKIYKNQSLEYEVSNLLYLNNFIKIGDLNVHKKTFNKNFKKFKNKYKEFQYSADTLYIKNPFNNKFKKTEAKGIALFLILFNYLDLAFFILKKNKYMTKQINKLIISNLKKSVDCNPKKNIFKQYEIL